MRTYLIFPKIMPRLISIHMTTMVLPFAIASLVTSTYLKTLREVLR